jgi:RHS repeat-associated protein
MKRTVACAACAISVLLVLSSVLSAQGPAIGTPPFGSFVGGPFDVINLGNLNVHFTVPILHKAGRGMPFAYDMTYDSSVWSPGSVNGVQTWQPGNSYWGWQGLSGGAYTSLTYTTTYTSGTCGQLGNGTWQAWQYSNMVYTDQAGKHSIGYGSSFISTNGVTQCPPAGPNPSTPEIAPAEDGSGLTAYVLPPNGGSLSASINNPHGITFPQGGGSYGGTDANGNEITANNGVYTDTLGQTALTVAGVPPSNTTFTYTAPSGAAADYAVSYKSYTVETNFGCSGVAEYNATGVYLIDKITLPDTTFYQFEYEATAGGSGQVTGRLASASLPTGGSITYTYPMNGTHNGVNCADGSAPIASGTNPSLTRTVTPGGTWFYARTQVSGAHWQTKITDPTAAANQTVVDLQQDSTTLNFYPTQSQVYAGTATGTPLRTTIICYNGVSISTPASCPTTAVSTPISRQTVFSYLPNPSSTSAESEIDTQYYSSIAGFSAEVDTYDYAKGAVGPVLNKVITAFSTIGPQVLPSSVTVEDSASNIKAYTSYSYDQWTPTATTSTPNHTSVTAARGNLTTVAVEANSSITLYRKATYYDTGMLNTISDWGKASSGGANTTTYNYNNTGTPSPSCGNSFVTSLSEPLSLTRSFTWNCTGGALTSVTDENGQTSSVYFTGSNFGMSADPHFWRPYAVTDQLNNPTTLSYPSNTVTESELLFNGNNSAVDQRLKFDAFGRTLLAQMKEGPTSSSYDSTQTDYDALGRASKNYLPFTNTADADCSGTCPGVSTTYDAANRVQTSTDGGGGTITYTFTNNDAYQAVGPAPSGENAKRKQLEYDGLGRVRSVCEITSATGSGTCGQFNTQTGFWTNYTFDALGDTTGVTQNAQAVSGSRQTRTYTFDMLGRTLSEQNPETGSITYIYDSSNSTCGTYTSAGDLVEKTDAMGNVTCMKYDALHRVTQTTYPSGTYASVTPTKCYVYDSATVNSISMTNVKTRLAEAYTTTASSCTGVVTVDEGFSYSARGEMSGVLEKTPDSSGYYNVNATYWAHGRLNVLNGGTSPLPGLPKITYGATGTGLDGKGRITAVTAASGQNPVNSISWNARNQVTGVTLGSLDNDAYQFDSNTGRMTQYKFNMGTGPTSQTGALTWNANGTLQQMQITDQINTANSQTCAYGHDDLTRIASANCGSVWAQTFSFDPFGNLSKTGSASFLPTYTGTSGTGTTPSNQYYQISGGSTGTSNYYDTNGNLKNDVTHAYTWDADGNMLSTDGSTVTMIYDALDRMAEQTRSSGHTEIVYGPYGMKLALMNGQTLVNAFVKLPGGARAVYNSSGLAYYRHADHLGSSRLATTTTRTKYYDVAYAPYGEDYNGSGTTADLAFTDENQDTVKGGWATNLYDFMFREYRPAHGRWTSPDPAGLGVVDPTNPQTWNRYAYVLNNPMALIDLLGDDCYSGSTLLATGGTNSQCWAIGGNNTWDPTTGNSGVLATGNPDPNPSGSCVANCGQSGGGGGSQGPSGGNGGGGGSPSPGPKKPGCGLAVALGAISVGLDIVGAIPGIGNAVSATAAGARAVNGIVAYGGAAYGIATGLPDEAPYGAASAGAGLGLTLADAALEGGKVIPVLGNFLSVATGRYRRERPPDKASGG